MPHGVLLDSPLSWAQVAKVAEGAPLALSDGARAEFARHELS